MVQSWSEWLWFADRRHIYDFSQKKRHVKEKKAVSPDHQNPLPSIQADKCTLYIYTVYMYTALQILRGPILGTYSDRGFLDFLLLINIFHIILRFSRSGFFGPSRCLIPNPGLTTEYPICAMCVCVRIHPHTPTYTHIHPHTLPPALNIKKTQTTPLFFLLSKMTTQAKQQVPS